MTCYSPLEAWYSKDINPSGKRSLVFSQNRAFQPDDPINIACGRCVGCRLKRSRDWAIRCMHESSLYEYNSFITLTFSRDGLHRRNSELEGYDDRYHPVGVHVRDLQLFFKRFRKRVGSRIRFYAVGEYGTKYNRPHYHACIFNYDFLDKKLFAIRNGLKLYTSSTLEALWPYGFSSVGSLTFESAAYVARYIMKKQLGDDPMDTYRRFDEVTGEYSHVPPEFNTMSNRPGIGYEWFKRYQNDVYPHDYVVLRGGTRFKPPKYYDKLLERVDGYTLDDVKASRLEYALNFVEDYFTTRERLDTRHRLARLRLKDLPRPLD